MKNSLKGFATPMLLGVIALLVLGGGIYYYNQISSTTRMSKDKDDISLSEEQYPQKTSEVKTTSPKQINMSSQSDVAMTKQVLPLNQIYALKNSVSMPYNTIAEVDVNLSAKIKNVFQVTDGVSIQYGDLVKVSIVKLQTVPTYIALKSVADSYDKAIWDSSFLTPPEYTYLFKLQKRKDSSQQIALWYSRDYFVVIEGGNILIDGKDNVMEAYLSKYPTSVLPPGASACADSDAGEDYFTRGTVKCGNQLYTDFCPANDVFGMLVEYVAGTGGVGTPHYVCPKGCNNGACIK